MASLNKRVWNYLAHQGGFGLIAGVLAGNALILPIVGMDRQLANTVPGYVDLPFNKRVVAAAKAAYSPVKASPQQN